MTSDVNPTDPVLTIGEFAASAGVNIETIRFYERKGILPEPPRTAAGYRQYGAADRWRLAFIRRGKALGFSLDEIGDLLGGEQPRAVPDVRRVAASRLARVADEIAELTDRRDQLRLLIEVCETGPDADCLDLVSGRGDCD